ncbi:MAG: hypothetical protein AAFX39_12245 [Pseudomonadota bacterium]
MAGADDTDADDRNEDGFLEGQFLIAMPSIGIVGACHVRSA